MWLCRPGWTRCRKALVTSSVLEGDDVSGAGSGMDSLPKGIGDLLGVFIGGSNSCVRDGLAAERHW